MKVVILSRCIFAVKMYSTLPHQLTYTVKNILKFNANPDIKFTFFMQ